MLSPEIQKLLRKTWYDGLWVRIVQNNDGSWWVNLLAPLNSGKYQTYAEQGNDLEAVLIKAISKLENPEDIIP